MRLALIESRREDVEAKTNTSTEEEHAETTQSVKCQASDRVFVDNRVRYNIANMSIPNLISSTLRECR